MTTMVPQNKIEKVQMMVPGLKSSMASVDPMPARMVPEMPTARVQVHARASSMARALMY